ncbi:MAG: Asp-tRNA(Asn)/Glu-tRNA(Gln) amidotransferase subunit GatC [Candidatus Omnitrophica bacterium]|nr:Asp-tRNA(Asn)/Glu-tRNA(Gln) amidotransferase subunit GatC [Candidatus Omnitrophota bacterium]
MSLDKDTINQVAHLARIYLKPEELNALSGQLKDILDFIDKLNKLDVQNVEPASHILPTNNVLRQDALKDSLPADKALENAPLKQGAFFGVPKIIE